MIPSVKCFQVTTFCNNLFELRDTSFQYNVKDLKLSKLTNLCNQKIGESLILHKTLLNFE